MQLGKAEGNASTTRRESN